MQPKSAVLYLYSMLCTLPERVLRVTFTLRNPSLDSFRRIQHFLNVMKSFDTFEGTLDTNRDGVTIQTKKYDLYALANYQNQDNTKSLNTEILNRVRWVANMRKAISELKYDLIYYQHDGISDFTLNQIESKLSEDGHTYATFHWTLRNAKHVEFYGLQLWAEKLGVPIENIPEEYKKHLNTVNRNELKLQ